MSVEWRQRVGAESLVKWLVPAPRAAAVHVLSKGNRNTPNSLGYIDEAGPESAAEHEQDRERQRQVHRAEQRSDAGSGSSAA
jgi:hypothetical protein